MRTKFYLIVKDVMMTRFMQDAGVFEPFKFVGKKLELSGVFEQHYSKVLFNFAKLDTPEYATVGIIIPGKAAIFKPDHRVMSDGNHWAMVDDICLALKAPLKEMK